MVRHSTFERLAHGKEPRFVCHFIACRSEDVIARQGWDSATQFPLTFLRGSVGQCVGQFWADKALPHWFIIHPLVVKLKDSIYLTQVTSERVFIFINVTVDLTIFWRSWYKLETSFHLEVCSLRDYSWWSLGISMILLYRIRSLKYFTWDLSFLTMIWSPALIIKSKTGTCYMLCKNFTWSNLLHIPAFIEKWQLRS